MNRRNRDTKAALGLKNLTRSIQDGEPLKILERLCDGKTPCPDYLGLTGEEAATLAQSDGVEVRTVSIDGWFGYTNEDRPERVSLIIEAGHVTRAWRG